MNTGTKILGNNRIGLAIDRRFGPTEAKQK